MYALSYIFYFLAICGIGVLLALVLPSRQQGQVLAWSGAWAAIALFLAGISALFSGHAASLPLWTLPGLATTLTLSVDRLSGAFLAITGLVLFPASIFAGGELRNHPETEPGRGFTVMMLGLFASIALVLISGDAVLFLLSWEVMSILCYLLIVCNRAGESGRSDAGYLLLALGEAGTLAAALAFLILATHAGGLNFGVLRSAALILGTKGRWAVFLLSFFGFGVKAGLVPVNFWLPRAYTNAPRAFAPVLAGATLNLGLYGIWRINADLLPALSVGPGLTVLVVGTISALVGILYATTDNDLKAMLGHSSIENAGIIMAAFGAGMVFVAAHFPSLAAIAFVAALYHLINHSLYKTLLFVGVGAVETEARERDMDRLGGLIKAMPLTAICFLAGSLSIAAMPPFNGFVSEWLTLQTLLRSAELASTGTKLVFALCGAGLALTAALAVTCFVKVFAMTFLGMRRLEPTRMVKEAPISALAPMTFLAVLCLLFGVLPTYVIPALSSISVSTAGASAADELVPPFFASNPKHSELPAAFAADFHDLGAQVGQGVMPGRGLVVLHRGGPANPVVFAMSTAYALLALLALLLLTYFVFNVCLARRNTLAHRVRWDGGIRRLLPEMTYSATGFSNPVRVIFDAIFHPTTVEDTRETVVEHFRSAIRREKRRDYLVDRLILNPIRAAALWFAGILAAMHHGRVNAYLAYALLALLVVWSAMAFLQIS
jgi:hydrogenase-4 component B